MIGFETVAAGGWVVAKSADRERMTSRAVLTYPCIDQQGDFVRPDGGDWDTYAGRLAVNWWHEFPVGRGDVAMEEVSEGGRLWNVPVGTSRFFKSQKDTRGIDLSVYDFVNGERRKTGTISPREAVSAAADVWRLVRDGSATGVSVEFNPDPSATTVTRSGKRYDRWLGRGWAHTPKPVNLKAKIISVEPDEWVVRAIHDQRWGDGSVVHPLVLKSLSARLESFVTRAETVTSGFGGEELVFASEDTDGADDYAADAGDDDLADDAQDVPPNAGRVWARHFEKALSEFAEQCRDTLDAIPDDPAAEQLEGVCALLVEAADAVLAIHAGETTTEPEPMTDPEPEFADEVPDDAPDDLELKAHDAPDEIDPRLLAQVNERLEALERGIRPYRRAVYPTTTY